MGPWEYGQLNFSKSAKGVPYCEEIENHLALGAFKIWYLNSVLLSFLGYEEFSTSPNIYVFWVLSNELFEKTIENDDLNARVDYRLGNSYCPAGVTMAGM